MKAKYLENVGRILAVLAVPGLAQAAAIDLTNAPLATSTALVKPNVLFILDDSGSMDWDYMPDWADDVGGSASKPGQHLIKNNDFNGVTYDPATTYSPPIVFNTDGTINTSTYPSMDGTTTSLGADSSAKPNWKAVKYDGYGKQTSDSGNVEAQSCSGSGSSQICDLTLKAVAHVFIPGEYCKYPSQKTTSTVSQCKRATAPDTASGHIYPVGLRWCSSSQLKANSNWADSNATTGTPSQADCQAAWSSTYKRWRYPGYTNTSSNTTFTVSPATSAFTVTGANTATTSIKICNATAAEIAADATVCNAGNIHRQEIMAGTAAANASTATQATSIRDQINACTAPTTLAGLGNCQILGYSASVSGSTVTINAPEGAITSAPVVTGATVSGLAAFTLPTLVVPGFNHKRNILPNSTSYAYPGTSVKAPTRTDCAGTTCTYNEEMTNYANYWAYYHTRMQMMKTSVTHAFKNLGSNYRVGYLSINNNTGSDFLNLVDFDITQKRAWYDKFYAAKPSNSTPLREALAKAGRLYGGVLNGTSLNGSTVTDPMTISCQQNFSILSTDGYWNGSTPIKLDGTSIGNQDSSALEVRPFKEGTAISNSLADTAQYYYKTDLRTTTNCSNAGVDLCDNGTAGERWQHMVSFTLGLGASGLMRYISDYATRADGDYYDIKNGNTANPTTGICSWQASGTCEWPTPAADSQTAIDDLWHAAVNGRGSYFSATSPASLAYGLSSALVGVSAKTGSSAAAATSSPTVVAGDNFIYSSTYKQPAWAGELVGQRVNINTGGVPNVDWDALETGAIVPAVTLTTEAALAVSGVYPVIVDWAAQKQLDNTIYTSRQIFRFDATNASATNTNLSAFTYTGLTTAQQAYFNTPAIAPLSQFCSSGSNCLSAGDQTAAAGANLVNFIRGDRTNEGDATATTKYFRQRSHVLGDIVNSRALYVKKPNRQYADSGYTDFIAAKTSRQGMVYVGANDGMLHAFYSSTACTSPGVPTGCDSTAVTGAVGGKEAWAFIPTAVLPNLFKLADKDYGNNHQFFVDGSPVVADICVATDCTTATASDWKTILLGGLNHGGRSYYALDVTDPTNPKALWEYTHTNMGYTYAQPEVGKLSNGTWVAIVSSGYNNIPEASIPGTTGDGVGRIYVLNAHTGTLVTAAGPPAFTGMISTGVGTVGTPSGLGRLSGWSTDVLRNKTFQRVYGGDMLGNLWRFDINNILPAVDPGVGAAGYGYDAQLLVTLKDASNVVQPITTRPALTLQSDIPLVYVGTGRYLGFTDVPNTQQQSFYGIKDTLASTTGAAIHSNPRTGPIDGTTFVSAANFVQQTQTASTCTATQSATGACTTGQLIRLSTQHSVNWETNNGWFVDFPLSGERLNTDPVLVGSNIAYATNVPSLATGCEAGGISFLNTLDKKGGADVAGIYLGSGIATEPTVAVLAGGNVVAWVQLSSGEKILKKIATGTGSTATRFSWRELIVE